MAAYHRVYDSRHLQADCAKNRDHLRNPTPGNRVQATFTFLPQGATESILLRFSGNISPTTDSKFVDFQDGGCPSCSNFEIEIF